MKKCSSCGVEKQKDMFYPRADGRANNKCKECSLKQAKQFYKQNPEYAKSKAKQWRIDNPERVKEYRAINRRKSYMTESKRKYGITKLDFDFMIENQNNSCATCKTVFDWSDKQTKPHIDHCHATGIVRGILCNRCNTILGLAKDDSSILNNLSGYLKCHGQ